MHTTTVKKFLQEDRGVIATEYVVFVAAIGILMAAGVVVLFDAMKNLFGAWALYFGAG